ncbi:hypothetical protein AAY86_11775 [Pseudomonas amygdali pv. tabaci str. ATCC 11528]|uniref:hypothetical protein n=1 Tax=Pseudomonas amygdali TaxID=47877 RepID=UPI0001BC8A64|nr:hypothetical protein [Pseudomonas amygdali]KEZ65000.1 hypothetical protein C1E_0224405 [Pseudomonas amygdali pv. tabaci str. ATCC 11528]KKY53174.1 hypothetical protein AAY86_11775 [Pseudomonas amygdali pv. tabaci str. ATCC 11528]QED86179.1 hypothetical protein PSYTB_22275 [Pseudomonas amygdali pv. tabaci str. ATCC 11528]
MAKYYFVRKFTLTLGGERQFHLLSLATGTSFKARLDPELMSKPIFPGMTYRASIAKRGRGLVITYLDSAGCVAYDECKALAGFVSTQKALPQYAPPSGLASILEQAALMERRSVRQLLDHESRFILGKHLGDAQTAQLQFAWKEYMAFQESVVGIMTQGFNQASAEQMVICLPVNACFLLAFPPMALSFLRADDNSVMDHPGFGAQPVLRKAWTLLRHLEAQSTAGNTLVEVASVYGGGADVVGADTGGDVIGSFIAGSDDVLEAIRECERHGWVVATEGYVQLQSNHLLQSAVRHHLTRICTPFHPVYSEREIEHAFSRLSAFSPDMFAFDMIDELTLALNSRVLLVRYDDIKAAIEFTQQYCAVSELLTNNIPTSVTVAKARCAAYETELGDAPVPFYEITDGAHAHAIVVHQFNQLPLVEICQLLAELENVVNLVALIDVTLPASAAVDQMSRYFPTVDIRIRQQGALPIQQCLRKLSEIEARINSENVQRIAVICDCPEIAQLLNRRYSSVPADTKVPKKGDLIRLSPRGVRRNDDALVRIVNVRSNELFISQSQTYRTIKADEFAGYSWDAGFALNPNEALGVELPAVLVFTCAQGGAGGERPGAAFVRNLQAQGVRVIEHCVYEIEGCPRLERPGTLQRIVPLVE